jgi:hypothetical protein
MTNQLERIKATRRGNRGVITKCVNKMKDLLSDGDSLDKNAKERLSTLSDLLEEKLQVVKRFDENILLQVVKRVDENILQLCKVEDIESEIEVSEELNSRVLDVKKQISKFLANHTGNVPKAETPNATQADITEVGAVSQLIDLAIENTITSSPSNSTPSVVPSSNINNSTPAQGSKTKLPVPRKRY